MRGCITKSFPHLHVLAALAGGRHHSLITPLIRRAAWCIKRGNATARACMSSLFSQGNPTSAEIRCTIDHTCGHLSLNTTHSPPY